MASHASWNSLRSVMPPQRRYSVSPIPAMQTRSRTTREHRPRSPGLSTRAPACDSADMDRLGREELVACVTRAGEIALGHFRKVSAERKPDRTLVTRADREVEAFLAAELGPRLPEAGILGE